MQDVSNYIQLTIPRLLVHRDGPLASVLIAAHTASGGVTITDGRGVWHSEQDGEVGENVYIMRWNFSHRNFLPVRDACSEIVDRMFELGEEAVLRERYYSDEAPLGYKAGIIYAPAKQ